MMTRTAPILAALFLLSGGASPASGQQETGPPLWRALEVGTHEVGFRRIWELDRTRIWPRAAALDSAAGEIARPVRVDVWYPARCPSEGRMPVGGYLDMEAPSSEFEDAVFLLNRWDSYSYHGLAGDTATFERLMDTPTGACADAPPSGGHRPLVLYSAGWFNRSPDNTVLAEYLASHGYVVAAVPQLNPGLWTWDFSSDAASVENQVRDLEVALGALIREGDVDRTRVAAMGYSTGGDVAVIFQGRNPLVDAVVALDASWTLGENNDAVGSPWFGPDVNTVPILALRRPLSSETTLPEWVVTLPDVRVAHLPGANHGAFSDDPPMRAWLGQEPSVPPDVHARVLESVRAFLDAVLGGTP